MTSRFILPFADVGTGITPSSGALLYFYESESVDTPKDTYSDAAGTIANANPVEANSLGQFPAIFMTGSYKVVLKSADGVQFWEADPVSETVTAVTISTASQISSSVLLGVSTVQTSGFASVGDGGHALYYADTADGTTADDGVSCIISSDGIRFKLALDGAISVQQAGAKGDYDENGTDDSAAFAAAWAAAQVSPVSNSGGSLNAEIYIPEGTFYLATGALFDAGGSGRVHIYGAGEGLTHIVVGDDQVGLDLSCGTPKVHDFTIWSKSTYDATVAAGGGLTVSRDTSGIGVRSLLGGRPRFNNITAYGFGDSGIYSTRMTKGIIDTCRVTGCGTGINIPTPSTTTTTSHITNNYVSSCDLGYNFNKVSHSTMYNNIAEGGTKGMFASLCTNSVFERMYFESNSDMHYEIKNSRCVIIDISEVDGTYGTPDNPSLFYNNASVALADIHKTDVSSDGISTSHLSLQSYDDGGSANKGFVKNEFLLTQTRQLRGLRINNRETASGAINAIGTFPLVNGAKGAHVSTLHVDASGNIVTADDMVASVSRTVTGEYHITLTTSAYLDWATASTYQSFVTTSTPNVLAQISYDNSTSTDFDDYEAGSPMTKIVVVTAAASTATRVNCGFTLQFGYNLPDDLLS